MLGKSNLPGSGITAIVNIDLDHIGRGSGLYIEKADKTDFGVLTAYDFRYTIAIALF
jgi:hypothetical protein